jgi:hypothetical protein
MRRLIGAFSVAVLLGAVLAGPAGAAPIPAPHPGPATLVARINGGGTATMDDGMGPSVWGAGVRLFSNGSASGQFDCLDQRGAAPGYPGNIWGPVSSWSLDSNGDIVLHITNGKFHPLPGGKGLLLRGVPFDITIQRFGGASVGHWTLSGPFGPDGAWVTVCYETLRSGQIVLRLA